MWHTYKKNTQGIPSGALDKLEAMRVLPSWLFIFPSLSGVAFNRKRELFILTLNKQTMKNFMTSKGETISAKSKLEGFGKLGYERIYWKGQKPYSVDSLFRPVYIFQINK